MLSPTRPAWAGRLARLANDLRSRALDAFVVTHPVNIAYLCGFKGSSGILVVHRDAAWLLTDGRYHQAVRSALAAGGLGPVELDALVGRYDRGLGDRLTTLRVRSVGFEAGHVTVATLGAWQRLLPEVTWVPTERVVERARVIKDAHEIETMRRGGGAISEVARQARALIAVGRTEIEIARDVDRTLERIGFSAPAFPTIVASGPNSALPHARPTGRRVAPGDLVLLDFGGVLDGYCLDLTRMAAVRPLSGEGGALFEAVTAAHAAAIAAVRPGVLASSVDGAARRELERRGYGEAFVHGTGHGLGLEVHEAPRIGKADPAGRDDTPGSEAERMDVLEAGMVCTIEPGAYVEGHGGVRLEDDILVTTDGCEVLTTAPRDLLIVESV